MAILNQVLIPERVKQAFARWHLNGLHKEIKCRLRLWLTSLRVSQSCFQRLPLQLLFSYSSHPCVTLRCYAVLSRFSHVHLFATLRTVDHQALQSMGFSRQEHWSGLPCSPPGDHPFDYHKTYRYRKSVFSLPQALSKDLVMELNFYAGILVFSNKTPNLQEILSGNQTPN